MDHLIDVLTNSGPLGILCAVLLFMNGAQGLIIRTLFGLYREAQEKRIVENRETAAMLERLSPLVDALREVLSKLMDALHAMPKRRS